MAIFFSAYVFLPDKDRTKTTLKQGNPHRYDHILLGASIGRGSLYKFSKAAYNNHYWIWNWDEFEKEDVRSAEQWVVEAIFKEIRREIERVNNNPQIRYPQHFIVGNEVMSQLGFIYQRSLEYKIDSKEILYYTFLGSTPIELGLIARSQQKRRKTLKPLYLRGSGKQNNELSENATIHDLYHWDHYEKIEKAGKQDLKTIMELYYQYKEK